MLNALFVDDEPSITELFPFLFSSPSVKVIALTDSREAIAYANRSPVDVIFLDYRMPGMNGDEVAKHMPPKIPKYLLTGDHSAGIDYEFTKVFSKPGFIDCVQEVLATLARKKAEGAQEFLDVASIV